MAKLNKTLFVVFCPNKSAVLNDYLPEGMRMKKLISNYDYMVKLAKKNGVNLIDFNGWFIMQKSIAKFPLYPKFGIHWSSFYENVAADSIIHFVEHTRKVDLPDFDYSEVEWCDTCRENDCDLLANMNLMKNPGPYKMPYSKIMFTIKNEQVKPSFLAISDSYWWNILAKQIPEKVFTDANFWFYNRDNITAQNSDGGKVATLNLKDEIMKRDVIMLMATEINYGKLGFGFIENAYKIFGGK